VVMMAGNSAAAARRWAQVLRNCAPRKAFADHLGLQRLASWMMSSDAAGSKRPHRYWRCVPASAWSCPIGSTPSRNAPPIVRAETAPGRNEPSPTAGHRAGPVVQAIGVRAIARAHAHHTAIARLWSGDQQGGRPR
jgi:hypothetical protein